MTSLLNFTAFNTTLIAQLFHHIVDSSRSAYDLVSGVVLLVGPQDISIGPVENLYDRLWQIFHFDEFQTILLKTFLLMQFLTLVLIFLSWKVYGKRISERFMKPATSRAIQELKDSVSRLKLPKEHTPRI